MKVRTLLFGAGQGSLIFMKNTSNEREFVGFLDNDKGKVGKTFNGISIHSPEELSSLHYDEIVITTQWALEVEKQLLEEIGVARHKVIMPQKKQLKNSTPFANTRSLELGREIIKIVNALAIERCIPLVVDFGTLLGLVRDKDIIPWDDDIDFSAPVESAVDVEQLLMDFKENNSTNFDWIVERVVDDNQCVAGMLLKFRDVQNKTTGFTTSICFREVKGKNAEHMPSLGMWFAPKIHFLNHTHITWNDCLIQVPFRYEEYLGFLYGDWLTPKKDMQLSDYAHLNEVPFADIQKSNFTSNNVHSKQPLTVFTR